MKKELEFFDATLGADFAALEEDNFDTIEQQTLEAGSDVVYVTVGVGQTYTINDSRTYDITLDGGTLNVKKGKPKFASVTVKSDHGAMSDIHIGNTSLFHPEVLTVYCDGTDRVFLKISNTVQLTLTDVNFVGTFAINNTKSVIDISTGSKIHWPEDAKIKINGLDVTVCGSTTQAIAAETPYAIVYNNSSAFVSIYGDGNIPEGDSKKNDHYEEEIDISGGTLVIVDGSTIGDLNVDDDDSTVINNQTDEEDIGVKNLNIYRDDTAAGMNWDIPSVTLVNDCDLSNTNITVTWIPKDNTPVILIDSANNDAIKFDMTIDDPDHPGQKITTDHITQTVLVNGETIGIGFDVATDPSYVLYYDDENSRLMLQLVKTLRELVEDSQDRTDDAIDFVNFFTIENNTKIEKHSFDSTCDDLAGGALSNKVLSAGSNKNLKGQGKNGKSKGTEGTYVEATLFALGNEITMTDLNWNGYAFGGGNGKDEKLDKNPNALLKKDGTPKTNNGNHFAFGKNTNVKFAFGGGNLNSEQNYLSTNDNGDEISTTLTVGKDATGCTSQMICGGSYVSSDVNVSGVENLLVEKGSDIVVTTTAEGGYIVGGSYVAKGSYTFDGTTTVDIESGTTDYVFAAGFVKANNSAYTHNGNVKVTLKGGSVSHAVFGGIGSLKDAQGITQYVKGDINMTIDSSSNVISLANVYGGCNGLAEIDGNITITFTGEGSNLQFAENAIVVGSNANNIDEFKTAKYQRILVFDDFNGDFGADSVKRFDAISFKNGSSVNFSNNYNLKDIKTWNFAADTSLNWENAGNADFSGDTLNLGELGESINDDWTVFTADDDVFSRGLGFDGRSNSLSVEQVNLFGVAATFNGECWATADYKLELCEDNSNQTYSLVVSEC